LVFINSPGRRESTPGLIVSMAYDSTLPAEQLFAAVWQQEFEPAVREKRRQLSERRTEAFLEVTLTLCGEEVRQMSALDMLQLDALGNPFIAGSPDGSLQFIDVAGFLWQLSAENDHTPSIRNLFRRSRLLRRLSRQPLGAMVREISAFVDRMLLDPAKPRPEVTPAPAFKEEAKTHFLAPLIAEVASKMGHVDPMSGELLAHIPLPRLLQYRDCYRDSEGEKTYDEISSLRNRCIERVAQIRAETPAVGVCTTSYV
jgi:hypothetical protein